MEYVVLARKLRPMRFGELIGQETVARALRNAVQGERTAHAYLFAGSRGVGKTSAARILTKALNCLAPQEGEPCNACVNCQEITSNAAPDIYEIDAASNRGIDNIRELRENTKYAPAKCHYKTYIIDEVHMLTMESFNALLKTLEEPPPHIKFILATTAPHRIPETILSRCQRFDFPRIPLAPMVAYLTRVTGEEGLGLSPASLELIARNAAGSMRDALTAVDQVVAFAGTAPGDEQVLSVLGVMDAREVLRLLGAVLEKSVAEALAAFAAIVEHGHDLTTLLEALLRDVKDLALYQTLGGATTYFQDHPPTTLEFFGQRKEAHSLDELQQLFHLFLDLEGQLKQSEHSRACFEMALIKACRVEPLVGVQELLAGVRALSRHPAGAAPPPAPERRPAAETRPRGRESAGAGGARSDAPSDQDGEAERAGLPPAPAPSAQAPSSPTPPAASRPAPPPGSPSRATAAAPQPAARPAAPPPQNVARAAPGSPQAAGQPAPAPASTPAEHDPPPAPASGQPTGPSSAAGPVAGGPPAEPVAGGPPKEAPPLDPATPLPDALCEDGRWVAFVEAVKKGKRPLLAAELRRAEVKAIGADTVEIVLPAGTALGAEDAESLKPALGEAFGAAFHLRLNHDTHEKARPAYTMVGREEHRRQARRLAERQEAEADEAVQGILRVFPESRIEHVQPRQGNPNGRDDV